MTDGWGKVAAGLGRTPAEDDAPETADGDRGRPVPAGWETLAARRRGDGEAPAAVATAPAAPTGWEHVAKRRRPPARTGDVPPVREDPAALDEDVDAATDDREDRGRTGRRRSRRSRRAPSGRGRTGAPSDDEGTDPDDETDVRSPDGSDDGIAPDDLATDDPDDDLDDDELDDDDLDDDWQPLTARVGERVRSLRAAHPRILLGSTAAVVAVIVAVVLVVVLSGGGLPANAAFSVNGKITTVAQLKSQVNVLDQLDGVTAPAQSDTSAYGAFLRTSAQALAVQQLVGDIAHREGISVPDKTTRTQLDQIVASKYNNDRSQFDAALSSAGLNENDVLSALNAQAVESALYAKHTNSKVPVTDAQVTAAYNANQPFTQAEQRAISIIVVATQATGQDIVNQLTGGADFATLAAQDSLDSSKSAGGADGTYSQQDLQNSNQTALASAVFGATQGVPFGPVQATGGEWVVGEVTAITPAATYGNDAQTQAAIKNYLTDQQLRQQWIAYLAKQLKGADITYAAAYRPAHPGQPPQPSLPSITQFAINAHQPASSTSTGAPGTTGTSPSSP